MLSLLLIKYAHKCNKPSVKEITFALLPGYKLKSWKENTFLWYIEWYNFNRSIASHYFNVISACESHWINRLETGVLCLLIKKQQNATAGFLYSVPLVFFEYHLKGLLWWRDFLCHCCLFWGAYQQENSFSYMAYGFSKTLILAHYILHDLACCTSIQVLSGCFRSEFGIKNWKSHQVHCLSTQLPPMNQKSTSCWQE